MRALNRLTRSSARRGTALIEFTLLGIPLLCVTTSVMSIGLDAWQYWSLAYATDNTARYISMHGATCSQNNNVCTITTGQIASFFESQSMALSSASVDVTLTDSSGTTTCNPVSNCASGSAFFPANTANSVGSDITVQATYKLTNPITMFFGNNHVTGNDYTVGAKSKVRIQF